VLRFALLASLAIGAHAQVAPTPSELTAYTGVFAAAAKGDAATIAKPLVRCFMIPPIIDLVAMIRAAGACAN